VTEPRRIPFAVLAFPFLTLAVMFFLRERPFGDAGALWHIIVGERILERGEFGRSDPFTWTHEGHFWIPQQWGAEVMMAGLHRLAGFDAILWALAVSVAGFGAWLTHRLIRGGLHPAIALAFASMGLMTAGYHFFARPNTISILLMGFLVGFLLDIDSGKLSWRRIWLIVPLTVVWTNLHGGVVGGLATVGFVLVGRFIRPGEWNRRIVLMMAGILLLAGVSTLLNPFGWEMHQTWWRILGSKAMKAMVTEHQPLDATNTVGQVVLAVGVAYVLILSGVSPKRWRVTWLLPAVWLVLSILSVRYGSIFCLVALVVIADLLPESIWYDWLRRYGNTMIREYRSQPLSRWSYAVVASPTLIVLIQALNISVPVVGRNWAGPPPNSVPVQLIPTMREYAEQNPGRAIFNDANWGGFSLYYGRGLKIFMDDRFELYGDDWMFQYWDMIHEDATPLGEWLAKGNCDFAVVQAKTKAEEYFRVKGWRLVAEDQQAGAAIYRRE
jgi:hypothetical protein